MKINRTNRILCGAIPLIVLFTVWFTSPVQAQSEWLVPDSVSSHMSLFEFDSDMADEGRVLYNRSCNSCHGDPGLANYAILVPSPGDPKDDKFQNQSDGSLFHKVAEGRDVMPGFKNIFADEEVWALVAYIRSFNNDYVQPMPDLTGIRIPKLKLQTGFDENIDKIVVKVTDEDIPAEAVEVQAYIKGMFGNLRLGTVMSNEKGLAFFHVDDQMPGDPEGNAEVLVRAKMGYGTAKSTTGFAMLKPTPPANAIEGRHLWASGKKAPLWIFIVFLGTVAGIWGALIYIVIGLFRLKRVKTS